MRPSPLYSWLASGLLLLLGGCVLSEQPLSAVSEARPDRRLVGTWHAEGESPDKDFRLSYTAHGTGRMTVRSGADGWAFRPGSPTFFVTRTAKASYLNVLGPDDEHHPEKGRHYQFFMYAFSSDQKTLRLRATQVEPFREAVRTGKLKGHDVEDSGNRGMTAEDVVLQDSSEAILRFLESLPTDKAFAPPFSCHRVD